jgi:hemerythrin-like metal-binding protein
MDNDMARDPQGPPGAPARPFFVWKDAFALGIPVVDQEHQRFFQIINELHAAIAAGRGPAVVAATHAKLLDYARYHFEHEEDYLDLVSYPDLPKHRAQHRAFVRAIERIGTGAPATALTMLTLVRDWLLEHILGMDQRYTTWVSEQRRRTSQGTTV